jgi:hypothetical protein
LGRHRVEVGKGRNGYYGSGDEFMLDAKTTVWCEDAELSAICPYFKTMMAHDLAILMCDGKEVEMLQVPSNICHGRRVQMSGECTFLNIHS